MRISAKVDYALRALAELAVAEEGGYRKTEQIAEAQDIPAKFLGNILQELRRAGLVESQRGAEGGHRLARPATAITVADVIRIVDGPLGAVAGQAPEDTAYRGAAAHLRETWVATRASLRQVLEQVTVAQIASGDMPRAVDGLLDAPDAWSRR
ncbi:MAG TPA: Rrf2 family transcriptional regulator [Conexibacter sp.]|nr:Rrf2 family transcriptional regulator [Conexibacter sp.]